MVPITTLHYLVVAAALFVLGVIGVLVRRNVVIVLMSIELILNAVNLNLVAFSRMWGGLHGPSSSVPFRGTSLQAGCPAMAETCGNCEKAAKPSPVQGSERIVNTGHQSKRPGGGK